MATKALERVALQSLMQERERLTRRLVKAYHEAGWIWDSYLTEDEIDAEILTRIDDIEAELREIGAACGELVRRIQPAPDLDLPSWLEWATSL